MFLQLCNPSVRPGFSQQEGNFQADLQEDFKSLLLETDTHGYPYKLE